MCSRILLHLYYNFYDENYNICHHTTSLGYSICYICHHTTVSWPDCTGTLHYIMRIITFAIIQQFHGLTVSRQDNTFSCFLRQACACASLSSHCLYNSNISFELMFQQFILSTGRVSETVEPIQKKSQRKKKCQTGISSQIPKTRTRNRVREIPKR